MPLETKRRSTPTEVAGLRFAGFPPFRLQIGKMAAPSNVSPMEASAPQQKRFIWTASLTHLLINVWQDHLAQLRAQKHNAPVYLRMTAVFNELASDECGQTVRVTTKQMKHKMENLAQAHK